MPRLTSHHREIPERFLRQLWRHRNFAEEFLRTTDNKIIEIIHPGTVNSDAGPDFLNAKIRIGGVMYRGAVELHRNLDDWVKHAHHKDPKYNSVILHVVFHAEQSEKETFTASNRQVPLLILEHYLTSSFRELWETMILDERAERMATIKCFSDNGSVESAVISRLLNKLSVERVELKMRRYDERLKELIDEKKLMLNEPPRYGEIPFGIHPEELPPPAQQYTSLELGDEHVWEQLLYEGYMEALGYSKNREPFLKLAKNLHLLRLNDVLQNTHGIEEIEAVLFGVAGLLGTPNNTDDEESKEYLARLTALWKNYRKFYHGELCDASEWQFFRLRPDNFPTVRLAGAARFLSTIMKRRFLKSIIQIVKNEDLKAKEKYSDLVSLLTADAEGFWQHHYRFGDKAKKNLSSLVGASRSDEIIQNVIVPVCFLYARIFKDKEVRKATLEVFEKCMPASKNSILETMEQQLIKGKLKLSSAKLQQGALQLYKFYCTEERCNECAIGNIVFPV